MDNLEEMNKFLGKYSLPKLSGINRQHEQTIAQFVKNPPAMQETLFDSWVRKIYWRRDRLPTPVFLGFPCGSAGKESTCNAGDLGSIPWLGRSPGEGKGYPLQYSGLENSMDCISMESQRVGRDWVTFMNRPITSTEIETHSMGTPLLWYENMTKRPQEKENLQVNITDEHRCKNPQQNISKLNPTIHYKNHIPWSNEIYPRDARIF